MQTPIVIADRTFNLNGKQYSYKQEVKQLLNHPGSVLVTDLCEILPDGNRKDVAYDSFSNYYDGDSFIRSRDRFNYTSSVPTRFASTNEHNFAHNTVQTQKAVLIGMDNNESYNVFKDRLSPVHGKNKTNIPFDAQKTYQECVKNLQTELANAPSKEDAEAIEKKLSALIEFGEKSYQYVLRNIRKYQIK